ncbi:hypothetical protein CIT26_07830 [Mesorhizobium temperatum]|uniref:Uncharacterized protein n=1 Tax=Mesorhizobium temperatum TaxID=241416 RepID=A0A271LR09_9HYPH|nr:hypothetical protein CIT26_07830 [Mesorhizobium temperatum]
MRLRGAVLEDQDNARRIDHTGAGWHRRSFDIHAATLLVEHACSRRSQPLAIMPARSYARFSKTLIQPTVCLPEGKWVAHLGNDGQRLKEFAQWPTRSGQEVTMDLKDRRLWYGVAAVIVVLVVIAYAAGWFGGTPIPAPQQ